MSGLLLLGPVLVQVGDREAELGGRRRKSLLAVLGSRANRRVGIDVLMEAAWPESPERKLRSLRSEMNRLRPALADLASIDARSGGYVLTIDREYLDFMRFEGLLADAETAAPGQSVELFDEALGLWRGDPAEDVASVVDVLQPWSERLSEMQLAAVEHRSRAALLAGHAPLVVVGQLKEFLTTNLLRERAWSILMAALFASDRRVEALRAYGQAQRALAEAGLEPGLELRRVERLILDDEPLAMVLEVPRADRPRAHVSTPARTFPSPATPLLGRQEELAAVGSALEGHRLVNIVAPAGMGKTRLAIEAGIGFGSRFTIGPAFADLSTLDSADAPAVAELVAGAMQLAPRPGTSTRERLVEALQQLDLLLVVDNCEHVASAVRVLFAFLDDTEIAATVLATSRTRIGLIAEKALTLPALNETTAVQLYQDRAEEGLGLAETGFDPDDVAALCQRLDHMPLAIELAAARAGSLSPSEMLSRLDDRLELVVRVPRGRRHSGLREAVEWSADLLDATQHWLFTQLSVFPDTFDLASVEQLCRSESDELKSIAATFGELADASLVERARHHPGRFRLLETFRQYGAAQLTEAEQQDLAKRHSSLVSRKMKAIQRSIGQHDDTPAKVELTVLWPDLRATQGRLDPVEAAPMLAGLGIESLFRERFELGTWIDRILDQETALSEPDLVESLATGSLQDWIRGSFDRGLQRWSSARTLQQNLGLPMTPALAFAGGVQLAVQHDYDRAALDLLDSIQLLREQGDEFGELHVWVGPGLAHLIHTGRSVEALDQLDSLQPRIDSLSSPLLTSHAAYRRSSALVNIDPESAIEASQRALDAAETAGTTWTVGAVRNYLAYAYLASGAPESAAKTLLAQLGAVRDGASSQSLANTLRVASGLLVHLGHSTGPRLIKQWLEGQDATIPGSPELTRLAGDPDRATEQGESGTGQWSGDRITTWVHRELTLATTNTPV